MFLYLVLFQMWRKFVKFMIYDHFIQPSIDLAEALISLGFAKHDKTIAPKTTKDAQWTKYLKELERVQAKATKKPLPWPLHTFQAYIIRLIYDKILPRRYSLPKLVR